MDTSSLPYIKSTENRFYSRSRPAYIIKPSGSAPSPTTQDQASRVNAKIRINREYLFSKENNGVLRISLIVRNLEKFENLNIFLKLIS